MYTQAQVCTLENKNMGLFIFADELIILDLDFEKIITKIKGWKSSLLMRENDLLPVMNIFQKHIGQVCLTFNSLLCNSYTFEQNGRRRSYQFLMDPLGGIHTKNFGFYKIGMIEKPQTSTAVLTNF